MKRLLHENDGEVPYDRAVDELVAEIDIAESTAKQYVADSMVAEKEKRAGADDMVVPSDHLADAFDGDSDELVAEDAGAATTETFGSLPVLEDTGHPEVPRHANTGYIRRRMSQDDESELHKKTDVDVVTAALADDDFSTLLIGKHGIGKDALLEHIAARTNRPMVRLVANDDPDFVDLLVGTYQPTEDGGFEYEEGLLTTALRHGYMFVLDEFNALSGKVQTMLNKILEDADSSEIVIPETNQVIEPHDEFIFAATMNPNEVGYGGREMLDAATSSRFYPVRLPPLSEDAERRVIEMETPFDRDDPAIDTLLRDDGGVVTGIRSLKRMGKTSTWISTRDVVQVARMADRLGSFEAAAEMVLVGRADPEDRQDIKQHISSQNW
ncbi:hypothetical protein Z052_01850 [Halorubrum sp. C191]|nr:hypothetical protein Z052_01850 [Halorubrum sp. C191]